eukprot:scaffold5093_cov109-Isochrysis_galbana.AAC.1
MLDAWPPSSAAPTKPIKPCLMLDAWPPSSAAPTKLPGQPERPWLLHVHALGRPAQAPIRGDAGDAACRHCLCRSAALGATAAAFAAALATSISAVRAACFSASRCLLFGFGPPPRRRRLLLRRCGRLAAFVCVRSWRENQNRRSGDAPII